MSPRTSKQNQEIREQSREKIMIAALELFAKRGYHNTSINQIAKKAEVAKGLVNYYFNTKEELLTGVVKNAMKDGDVIVEQIMSVKDPKDRFRFVLDLSFKWMEEKFEYGKLLTAIGLQLDQFPDIVHLVLAKYKDMIPMLESMLKDLGVENYKAEAKMLAALMDGIGIQYITLHDDYSLDEMKGYIYDRYGL